MKRLFSVSYFKRFLFFLICDTILIAASLYLSFLFHFDFDISSVYFSPFLEMLPYFIFVKMVLFALFRIYKMTWRYVGIFDLFNIVVALVVAAMALIILSLPISFVPVKLAITGFPKRIILEDSIISVFLITGLRISKRLYLEVIRKQRVTKEGKRTIVLGAGNTGEMIIREMVRTNSGQFYPVGFLDDDTRKLGTYLHGIKVVSTVRDLRNVIRKYDIEAVIVAIPSLNHKVLKSIYNDAKKQNVSTVKIVPRIYNFDKPDINMKNLEDISIEDLVGRQSVTVDYKEVRDFLNGKSVLITGAGGSIGSEIVNQVCGFEPRDIVAFDIDETELHNLQLRINRLFPHLSGKIYYRTGDVRDTARLTEVFEEFRPQLVFHAAAYKHVPMMEYNPKEAVKVNILGTYALARTARQCGVDKFIMISTDKAVRPTSIMGATKRMAEFICTAMNNCGTGRRQEGKRKETTLSGAIDGKGVSCPVSGATKFTSVRFGNVLGSRGSMLPLFLDQLKYGGPITVTHKEMRRYFMTIPEAVSLVLQASAVGGGGEVLVLDMGEPVYIVDVAEELIRIHGLKPYEDIDIQYTGLRPGEKLFEEILTAEEGTVASKHEKIFIARNSEKYDLSEIESIVEEFREIVSGAAAGSDGKVKETLKKYVKHYEQTANN